MIASRKWNATCDTFILLSLLSAFATWLGLLYTSRLDKVGLWALPVALGIGCGFGWMLGQTAWKWWQVRVETRIERLRDLTITVEVAADGSYIALASNQHVATTLQLPLGYDPNEDEGRLMAILLWRELTK